MAGRTSRPAALRIARWVCLTLSALAIVSSSLLAQSPNTENTLRLDDPASPIEATVDSLHWLAGFWQGESSIGRAEEIWAPPSDGTMMGAFKVVQKEESQPYFYEFVEISEVEGRLTLKVKHFSADLQGWEDKDDYVSFPLVRLGEREVFFEGLTYRLIGDRLHAYVAIKQTDGSLGEIEFNFKRQAP